MGAVASCCNRPMKEDINIDANNYYISPKNYNKKRRDYLKKRNYLDINNLIVSEEKDINESNNKNNENNTEDSSYDLEKIKKIQKNYHSHYTYRKFMKELKPSIERKTTNYLNKLYEQCSLGGKISIDDDFTEDGWKKYYPPNERFFLYNKGNMDFF